MGCSREHQRRDHEWLLQNPAELDTTELSHCTSAPCCRARQMQEETHEGNVWEICPWSSPCQKALIKTRHKGSIEETAVLTKIPFLRARAVLVTPGQPVDLGRDAQVGARPCPRSGHGWRALLPGQLRPGAGSVTIHNLVLSGKPDRATEQQRNAKTSRSSHTE